MSNRFRSVQIGVAALLAAVIALASPAGSARAQTPEKVRVLVATRNTDAPLQVSFITKGAVARGLLLPFGGLGNAIAFDARNKTYNEAVGGFDRRQSLVGAVENALEKKYATFDLVDDGARYRNDDDLKTIYARAQSEGIRYVLLIEDQFSGISSAGMASDSHGVSVASGIRYELQDAQERKRLAKDRAAANSLTRLPLENALTDRAFLDAQMPAVHAALANLVVGGLVRTDSLHAMAKSAGQDAAVPALGALLKRYEKPVAITIAPPSGWRTIKFNTRYAMSTEPKSELRFKLGVRADVDVLIEELGQDVDTIEAYQQAAFVRLSEFGFDIAQAQPREDFAKEGYQAISVVNPETGGGQLLLFRKIDDTYVSVITVIATERFEDMLKTHAADIQKAIDGVRTTIR